MSLITSGLTELAKQAIQGVINAVISQDEKKASRALKLALTRQMNKEMADNRRKELKRGKP